MKRFAAVLIIFLVCMIFCGCFEDNITIDERYSLIRIHIRADSNAKEDQAVKLKVRDKITAYLNAELGDITDREQAFDALSFRTRALESIADAVLQENGFAYRSTVRMYHEYFPTRQYENVIVESGYYDALIVELGSGSGDNWWCVIYPPLCYLEAEASSGFRYKSKIKELLDKYFKEQ